MSASQVELNEEEVQDLIRDAQEQMRYSKCFSYVVCVV